MFIFEALVGSVIPSWNRCVASCSPANSKLYQDMYNSGVENIHWSANILLRFSHHCIEIAFSGNLHRYFKYRTFWW